MPELRAWISTVLDTASQSYKKVEIEVRVRRTSSDPAFFTVDNVPNMTFDFHGWVVGRMAALHTLYSFDHDIRGLPGIKWDTASVTVTPSGTGWVGTGSPGLLDGTSPYTPMTATLGPNDDTIVFPGTGWRLTWSIPWTARVLDSDTEATGNRAVAWDWVTWGDWEEVAEPAPFGCYLIPTTSNGINYSTIYYGALPDQAILRDDCFHLQTSDPIVENNQMSLVGDEFCFQPQLSFPFLDDRFRAIWMAPGLPEHQDLSIDIPQPPPKPPVPITRPQVLSFRPAATDTVTGQTAGSSDDEVLEVTLNVIKAVGWGVSHVAEGVADIADTTGDVMHAVGEATGMRPIAQTADAAAEVARWVNADATAEGLDAFAEFVASPEGQDMIAAAVVKQTIGRIPKVGPAVNMAVKGHSRAQIAKMVQDDLAGMAEDMGLEGIAQYAADGELPETFELEYTPAELAATTEALKQSAAKAAAVYGNGGFIYGKRAPRMAQRLKDHAHAQKDILYEASILLLYDRMKRIAVAEAPNMDTAAELLKTWFSPQALAIVQRHLEDLDNLAHDREQELELWRQKEQSYRDSLRYATGSNAQSNAQRQDIQANPPQPGRLS